MHVAKQRTEPVNPFGSDCSDRQQNAPGDRADAASARPDCFVLHRSAIAVLTYVWVVGADGSGGALSCFPKLTVAHVMEVSQSSSNVERLHPLHPLLHAN